MNVLIDECLDPRLEELFERHTARSVRTMGWIGLQNGALLTKASIEFDAFLTIDRNLPFQQNLPKYELAVVVVLEARNDPQRFREMVARVEALLDSQPEPGLHWINLS